MGIIKSFKQRRAEVKARGRGLRERTKEAERKAFESESVKQAVRRGRSKAQGRRGVLVATGRAVVRKVVRAPARQVVKRRKSVRRRLAPKRKAVRGVARSVSKRPKESRFQVRSLF